MTVDNLRALVEAAVEIQRLAGEVRAWVDAEAREGRLRYNRDAPTWGAYADALAATGGGSADRIVAVAPELLAVVDAGRGVVTSEGGLLALSRAIAALDAKAAEVSR